MRSVITGLLVALLVTLGLTSALADIVYTVFPFDLFGISGHAHLTGTITTDGVLGALTPADIVSWQLTDVESSFGISGDTVIFTAGSPTQPTWSPGSITATTGSLVFDFGIDFTNSVHFPLLSFFGGGCGPHVLCGTETIGVETQVMTQPVGQQIVVLTRGAFEVPVPGPTVGAGLPGLMLAGAGMLGWWRRKRKAEAAA